MRRLGLVRRPGLVSRAELVRRAAVLGLLLPCVWLVWLLAPWQARAQGTSPDWRWPLPASPVVDRSFAPGPTRYSPGHLGVDLRAAVGAVVGAAGPGRVSFAGLVAGRGVVVVAHQGGLRTTYEPVHASVRVGQQVSAGQALGTLTLGHPSCRSGTACLHWGLRRGDTYLDPLALLRRSAPRLLPVGGPEVVAAPGAAAVRPRGSPAGGDHVPGRGGGPPGRSDRSPAAASAATPAVPGPGGRQAAGAVTLVAVAGVLALARTTPVLGRRRPP